MKQLRIPFYFTILISAFVIYACNSDDETGGATTTPPVNSIQASAVIENYANLVFTNYQEAFDAATALQTALTAFTDNPTQETFDAAKTAWLAAREPYGQTEAFRFANGPIDDVNGPEGLLNAWPLDENYVDYVEGNPNAGIINDPVSFPSIDAATLEGSNELGGEANVSVGYHAIEFLLWGQDNTAPLDQMAGQRPFTDFVDGGTASNQDRRRMYINVCAQLILDNLQSLLDEWEPGGSYRTTFLALDENTALRNILTGIATLSRSELAGERVFVAFDNQDQEDEHSCFSDNTHRDLRLNLAGIANVYRGSFATVNGASLEDLITQADATLGAAITAQLEAAETATEATAIPFDFAISSTETRPDVLTAVNALRALGDQFAAGGTALGISVSSDLPE